MCLHAGVKNKELQGQDAKKKRVLCRRAWICEGKGRVCVRAVVRVKDKELTGTED